MTEFINIDELQLKERTITYKGKSHKVLPIKVKHQAEFLSGRFDKLMKDDPEKAYIWIFKNLCPGLARHVKRMNVHELELAYKVVLNNIKKTREEAEKKSLTIFQKQQ